MAVKPEVGTLDLPIFVPQHGRTRVAVHLVGYNYPWRNVNSADDANVKQHRVEVTQYLNENGPNLNGFEIFDHTNHYEIVLPPGWKPARHND